MTTDTQTLTDIAGLLDQRRLAIEEARAQIAALHQVIAGHEQGARDLIAEQERLTRASFAGLFGEPEPAAKTRRPRNGNGTVDYTARMAARKRNAAIRTFAQARGLECPATGSDFSEELVAAFNQDGGYVG